MTPQYTNPRHELIACLEAGELTPKQTAELMALVEGQRSGWRPIETIVHESGNRVLIYDGEVKCGYWDAYYAKGGRGYTGGTGWVDEDSTEVKPTHWQPLPPPPGEEPTQTVTPSDQPVIPAFLIGLSPEKCNEIAERINALTPEEMKWAVAEHKRKQRPDPQPDALAELERWLQGGVRWVRRIDFTGEEFWFHLAAHRQRWSGRGKTISSAILAALGKAGAR